jgi:hypothetical protein
MRHALAAFSNSGLAWVVNAYVIPFGGLLLLAGRFGDLLGQRRIFLRGVALFTADGAHVSGRVWIEMDGRRGVRHPSGHGAVRLPGETAPHS